MSAREARRSRRSGSLCARGAAIALLALLGTALAACGKGSAPATASPPGAAAAIPQAVRFAPGPLDRLGVRVEAAGGPTAAHSLGLPGTLEYASDRYAEVGVLVEGRVTSLSVKVGDVVKKGQVLGAVTVPAIVTAQGEAIGAQASLKVAREHAARESALFEKQLTTARELEVAKGEQTKAEADLAAATAKLRLFGAAVPSEGQALVANGSIPLVAPIDGVIVRRDAVLGGFLRTDETAFAIADATSLWAILEIFEADLAYVAVGADATIEVDALPGRTFKGKLAAIEPDFGKASRTVRARVVVENEGSALRAGSFVRATIPIPSTTPAGALLVPGASVQPLADRDVVFVEKEPGAYEVRPVTVGRRTAQVAEITDGLAKGERIAVHGAFLLRGEISKQ
jgi:cobalt-zinc-cadmium efflux system membrane fusion protein